MPGENDSSSAPGEPHETEDALGAIELPGPALVKRLAQVFQVMTVGLVIALMFLFAYEVAARYLFGNPTGFANQLGAYITAFIMAFGASYTLLVDGHVKVDFVLQRLPSLYGRRLTVLNEGIGCLIALALATLTAYTVWRSYERGFITFAATHRVSEWMPQLVMPLGFTALLVVQVFLTVRTIQGLRLRADKTAIENDL